MLIAYMRRTQEPCCFIASSNSEATYLIPIYNLYVDAPESIRSSNLNYISALLSIA